MPALGPPELIVILLIVVVLFGASRLGGVISGLGRGIREFRHAVKEDQPSQLSAAAGSAGACPACGSRRLAQQRFCAACGAALESPTS